jgi:hypothetical protein
MPATTPPKGRPTPKRDDQRRNRRRGLPHEEQPVDEPIMDIVGSGSITLPSISASKDE